LLHNVFAKSRTLVHSKNCTDPAGYAANNPPTIAPAGPAAAPPAVAPSAASPGTPWDLRAAALPASWQSCDRWDAIFHDVFS
jgi:hypothetical protein